ncbi:MAG: HAMP domain-containing histidine kinase, partial [Muribaculaceae bacterium]|nr:HAMP domain-containing histidine kinase [Muribaculaceae bacterium]
IQSLVLDDKKLWIGADNVLYLLKDGNIQIFNQSDGVVPNEFIGQSHLLTADYVFMGGINGLQKINRAEIDCMTPDQGGILLGLSDVSVDGVSKFSSLDDGRIDVPSSHSSITVNVIDREQNAMRRKLFRFNVDGLNLNGPIETFDRTFTLNVLPAGGVYRVSVACSRPDGSWTDPVEIVELHVMSPWWRSWWAILIYVAVGLSCVYAAYRIAAWRKKRRRDEFKRKTLEREVGLLTNINYELRTPLTLIYSPLKVLIGKLKRSGSDQSTVAELENIYRHTKEMRDVINMPMELWHVEATGAGTEPELCDFNQWLGQEIGAADSAIELRRIHVDYSPDSAVGEVMFDRTRLAIVISNMLMAAIKHSPKGSTLGVSSRREGGNVRVEIHDQGDSLSETEIQQVFSGHYNNYLYGGGFGLAYAKMLMDMQQGRIGVESGPEHPGVTIWIELPVEPVLRTPADNTAESVDETDLPGSVLDAFDTSGSSAIVVEDNEELCMFMVSHLQGIFKKVYNAYTAAEPMIM